MKLTLHRSWSTSDQRRLTEERPRNNLSSSPLSVVIDKFRFFTAVGSRQSVSPAKGRRIKSESPYMNRHTVQSKLGQTVRWVMAPWCLRFCGGWWSLRAPLNHMGSLLHLRTSPFTSSVVSVDLSCLFGAQAGSRDDGNTHPITWVSAGSRGACDARDARKALGN